MAASGYDIPQQPSLISRYDARRTSGPMSGIYDRSGNAPSHRRTPSPATSRRGYDSYVPPRAAPVFRGEDPNVYRQSAYRHDYSSRGFYDQQPPPPSPERYSDHPREPDHWDRPSAWQTGYNKPPGWQDREPVPPSPTGSVRSRGRDDILATRMFEPSDTWRQAERASRDEGPSYTSDRYFEPSRMMVDPPSDPYARPPVQPRYHGGGDRYRPSAPAKRPTYPTARADYDSYRPPYENKRDSRGPFNREPSPPRSYRRDSAPSAPGPSRPWDHYEPPAMGSLLPPNTRSRSRSPDRRGAGGALSSPMRADVPASRLTRDEPDFSGRKQLSRRSSRSSIASTQVSETQNVGKSSVPPPPDVPNGSTRVEESIRSVPAVLPSSTASSRPSSTASTPPPPQFNGPQALLANRFKAAQISSPAPSSPLSSSVVPGENAPEIAKSPLAEEPKTEKRTESPEVSSGIQPSANNSLNGHAPSSGARVEPAPATQTDEATSKPPVPPMTAPADDTAGAKDDDKLMEPAKSPPPPSSTREPDQTPATELPPPREPSPPPPPVTQIKPTSFTFQSRSDVRPPQPTPVFEANDEPRLERQVLLELQPIFPRDALPTEQKPSLTNPKSKEEALRAVVMTRLLCDHQTRDELVNPVLMANRAIVDSTPDPRPTADSTPDKLIAEVHRKLDESIDFATIRPSLAEHFEQRQNLVNDKVSRLSAEYLALHRKWKAHCSALNALQRSQGPESDHLLHGRTTRRTSAFTDTVRSDLEMEQVIASLGVDDLTDPNYLSSRNAATIPDMISVTEGKVDFLFDDSNHLVENPAEYYAPHTGIDDWTEEEKRIFLDRYAMYPKQFGLIAEGLPHKTAAQCVDYYYLHKKRMIDFRKVVSQLTKGRRKRGGAKKKSGALLADIAQHDAEVGKSDHLSNFIVPSRVAKPGRRRGRASAVAKTPHSGTPAGTTPQPEAVPPAAATAELRPPSDVRQSRSEETPVATPTPEPESRAKRTTRKPASTQPSTPAPPPPPPVSAPPAPAPAPSISTPVPVPATQPRSETVSAPPEPEQPKPRNRKRGRKQVKSAAIIEDDTTPPPEAPKPLPSDEPTSISVALRASTSKGSSRITPASEQESEMSQSDWP